MRRKTVDVLCRQALRDKAVIQSTHDSVGSKTKYDSIVSGFLYDFCAEYEKFNKFEKP